MTLLVNYRGGFAKLSDLGIITRDYVARFFSSPPFKSSTAVVEGPGSADSLFDGA